MTVAMIRSTKRLFYLGNVNITPHQNSIQGVDYNVENVPGEYSYQILSY